jgi:hypothetical protein
MHNTDPPRCRACRRPLSAPLAVFAGLGARCAARLAAQRAGDLPTTAQTAVALIAALGQPVDQAAYDGLTESADMTQVAGLIAAGCAIFLRSTPGGPEWLECLGLAAAEGR